MEPTAMPNTAAAKARLEAQLAELEGRQDRIARDLAEPLNPDSSEQAIEMEDDDSLEGQAALIAREVASVKRALTRIENGTYGVCVRCGDEIATKRLEARPEAALCIECARKEQ
jgi:RNA polymerase-binding protein DksA